MGSVFQTWLPSQLADAPAVDRQQLASLSVALASEWSVDASLVDRLAGTVKWIPLVKTLLETKAQFDAADIRRLADTLLDIVFHGTGDQVALVRWAGVLAKVLGSYRHKLRGYTIAWRPLHQLIRQQCITPPTEYIGPMVFEAQRSVLVKFVRKCRRYFPPGTAAEVWEQFKGPLASPLQPMGFEALGFLNLLMPTHAVALREGDWAAWLPVWLGLQDAVAHCRWWDATWMDLISRVAKHDKHGVVAWGPLVPRLYTSLMWAFHVPVGTATATPPFSRSPPTLISSVLSGESTSRSVHGAKLAVWLLGQAEPAKEGNGHVQHGSNEPQNGRPAGKAFAAIEAELELAAEHGYYGDPALAALAKTGDLIEQYLHPSNDGQWVSNLSRFLQHLVGQLGRRLTLENSPKDIDDGFDSESDDGSEAPQSGPGDDEQPEADGGDEDEGDVDMLDDCARTPLGLAVQRAVAAIIIRLASRAQYSKDNVLNSVACHALARMAYIAPDLVLPLMHERFELALEAVSAVHQLTSAFHTMSLCVRPLLIAGCRTAAGHDPMLLESADGPLTADQVAAGQLLATAMTVSLPGIDANDPPKSLACFRLYTVALCSIGALNDEAEPGAASEAGFRLPLYVDEWVEELLSRIFAILSNLENPNQGDDSARLSFLLEGNSMFRPMVELLFARLPPTMRSRAISRLARFVTTNTLPSVTQEAAILCNAAGWADPAAAASLLLEPLLEQLEAELPALRRVSMATTGADVSKVQEASVTWRLGLLSSAAFHMGKHLVQYKKRLQTVLSVCFDTTSQSLHSAAMRALSSILYGLLHFYLEDQFAAPKLPGAEPFIDKKGRPLGTPPIWHDPTPDEMAFAEELLQTFLLDAAGELRSVCSSAPAEAAATNNGGGGNGGALPVRKRIRSLLLRMEGVIIGARTCLPDFEQVAPPDGGTSLVIKGSVGAIIGTPAAKEALADALLAAAAHVSDSDSETLVILLRLVEATLAAGLHEYTDQSQSLSAWRADEKLVHEPALAFMLQASGSGRWRRRRARWLMAERTYITGIWRASQAAYRPWVTTLHPRATLDMIPPTVKNLAALALRYSLNPYTDLRNRGVQTIESVMRRYPALVPAVLPAVLRALAGIPQSSDAAVLTLEPAGVTNDLLQELRPAVQATVASETQANGKGKSTGDLVREGRGIGAASILQARVVWRRVCRDPDAFAATMTALLGSAVLTGERAQTAVTHLFITVAFRFVRPPAVRAAMAAGKALPPDVVELQREVLRLASGGARETRYAMLASALLLLLAPLPTDIAEQAAQHWFGHLQGGLLSHQTLAITALTAFIGVGGADVEGPMAPTLTATVARLMREQGGVAGQAIMAQMAHNHPHHDANEEGSARADIRAMFGQLSRGDAAVGAMRVAFDRFREWPARPTRALQDGTFKVHHARLIQVLATTEPEAAVAAFREPLEAALAGAQDADRPHSYAAAEVLAGLLASGALFAADAGTEAAWYAWAGALLRKALSGAPLDLAGLWGVAVRFGINGVAGVQRDAGALASVLELISEPTGPGAPSSAIIKRGRCMYHAAAELADLGAGGDGGTALDAAARAFQRRVLDEAPALMKHSVDAVHVESMRTAAVVCGLVFQQAAAQDGSRSSDPAASLDADAAAFCEHAISCLDAGVAAVYEAVDSAAAGVDGGDKAKSAVADEVAAQLGAALLLVSEGLRWGEGPQLAPTAVRMLPSLLRLQEVKVPELQRLELLGKTALAVVKYLPLSAPLAARVAAVLTDAPAAEPWSARAAALVFAQYFWFRHAHLLSPEDDERLQAVVVSMLSDSKLEVREVAATTLSGLLKGASPAEAARLRASFLLDVDRLFPRSRKRQKAKAGTEASGLSERHAAVLGLQAFVQLSAYDVPPWLPGVLTALTSAAVEPAPIRTTVRRALGDFRRTHEESGLAETRRLLTPEEYEAIQEVEAPASYYI